MSGVIYVSTGRGIYLSAIGWIMARQKKLELSPNSVHSLVAGVRFFHKDVLKESDVFLKDITLPKRPKKIPYV